jgi:hypothetical protein
MKTQEFKKKIVFMLFTMFIYVGANAQDKEHNPESKAKKQTEWMKTELSLTEDQSTKVEGINLSYANKKKALKENMRNQMKSLEEEKQKELAAVLSKEQMAKLDAKKVEMKAKHKNGRMNHKKCGDKNKK